MRIVCASSAAALASGTLHAQVELSQVYGAGGNTGAKYVSDYVEIYNAGAPQSLSGWSVQVASGNGATWSVTALPNVVLGTGQYFLVQQANGSSTPLPNSLALPTPGVIGTNSIPATDGKIALCNSSVALVGATPGSATIVDFVGYGSGANWNEPGAPFSAANNAPSPSSHNALFRLNCGSADTAHSSGDWAVGTPSPRNSATPANGGLSGSAACRPHFAEPLQSVRLIAEPYACGGGTLSPSASVVADLSSVGGASAVVLNDSGAGGDEFANDGLWSLSITLPNGLASGTRHLAVSFADGALSGGTFAGLQVLAPATPDNDQCSTATPISAPYPASAPGNFTGATAENDPLLHAFSVAQTMSSRRGLWYQFTGTGHTMTVDACASPLNGGAIPDTVLMVLGGTCDALSEVAFNDNAPALCGVGTGIERRSKVSFATVSGAAYWAWIAPFSVNAQTFSVVVTVSDDGVPSSGALSLATAAPATFAAPLDEAEPAFGPASDDGCDSTAGRFRDVAPTFPPIAVHGTARQDGAARDTDWYRFQAPSADELTARVRAQFHAALELRHLSASGTCSTSSLIVQSQISERCAQVSLDAPLVAGDWYAVRVVPLNTFGGQVLGGFAVSAGGMHYRLELQLGGPPGNDTCAEAAPLALGASVLGTTVSATADGSSACDASGADVWYAVTLANAGTLKLDTCGSAVDTALTLYGACGGAPIACDDSCGGPACGAPHACLSVAGLSAGTYLVRVSDHGLAGGFVLSAEYAPDHDVCSGAIALALPSNTAGTTNGARVDPGLPPASGPLGDQDFSVTAPGVWYSLVLPGTPGVDDRVVYADTLIASYDTRLSVFAGSCGALAAVTANDDMSANLGSKVAWRAVAGTTYFLLVHGDGSTTGTFTLRLESQLPLANDDCGAALDLDPSGGSLLGTLVGATGASSELGATDLASCAGEFTAFDVWYRLTAACDAVVTFDTCGATDTVLSIHGPCPSTNASHELGECNDEAGPGCAPGSRLDVAVASGSSYYVRVAQKDGATAGGPFTLTWSISDLDGDGLSDCDDGCPTDPNKIAPGQCGCGFLEADSDGDGAADCVDGCPNDPNKVAPGQCGCGLVDLDSDGDGTADCVDACPADPNKVLAGQCGCGVLDLDTDGDGTADCVDGCPSDPNKVAPGACGCGVAELDSDGDGTPDCVDGCPSDPNKVTPGACGCGVAELDGDGDGTPDCIDGCPADPAKTAPGACGCGVPDADGDGDGVLDCDDNCDTLANPAQQDCDLDGVGDACELAAGTEFDTNGDGTPDDCQPGSVFVYCTAGTTTHGCNASMSSSGSPSLSGASFVLTCSALEAQKQSLLFYGVLGPSAVPWSPTSTSFKCVRSPLQRTPATNTGGTAGACDGALSLDFFAYVAAHPGALGTPVFAGEVFNAQVWFRDPPAPKTTNLSNALQWTVAP